FKLCKPGIAFQDTDILLQLFLRIKKISSNLKKNFCNEFKHAPTPFPVNLVFENRFFSNIFSISYLQINGIDYPNFSCFFFHLFNLRVRNDFAEQISVPMFHSNKYL